MFSCNDGTILKEAAAALSLHFFGVMETALTAFVDTVTASTRRITTVVYCSIMRYQMQLALSYTLCASTE